MIYRVGDNENNKYDYNRLKTPQYSGGEEKFSLDYQKEEALSPKKEEDKEENKLHEKSPGGIKRQKSGVTLEISNPSHKTGGNDRANADKAGMEKQGASLLGSLQQVFRKIVQALKDVFDKIWNDPDPDAAVQSSDVTPEEAERYTEEYLALKGLTKSEPAEETAVRSEQIKTAVTGAEAATDKEAEIQKYLHSGNLAQVISLLTDNGQKTIAKNSNLLTYYDRSGKLTEISPSDKERILHGDRNVRKL